MMIIDCVCYPKRTGPHFETLNKNHDELVSTSYNWVNKCLELKKAPNGMTLEACDWHSGKSDNGKPPIFGIWINDDNHTCFDVCNAKIRDSKNKEIEDVRRMERLIGEINHWFGNAKKTNDPFQNTLIKRKEIQSEINKLDNKVANMKHEVHSQSSEYKTLIDIQEKAQFLLDSKIDNLTKIHESSKNIGISLSNFIQNHTADEHNKLEHAKNNAMCWYNTQKSKNSNVITTHIMKLRKDYDMITKDLTNTYKTPFAYLYKAYLNLKEIDTYYGDYSLKREYTREEIKDDIMWCRINLDPYYEFIGDIDPMKIVDEVEKSQIKARNLEKQIKASKSIEKVQSAETFVVNDDGTVTKIHNVDQIVIGSNCVEENDWRNGQGFNGPSTPVFDDNKWTSLR